MSNMVDKDDLYDIKCRIIAGIHNNPVIYDKDNHNHYKRNMKELIYNGIADLINQQYSLEINGKQ